MTEPTAGSRAAFVPTLAFTTAIQIIATAAVLSLTAIVPVVAADLRIDPHVIGYQISLIYLAAMIASATAGRAIARFGPSGVEQLCLLTFAAGLLCFASGRISLLLVGSLVIGIGYGWQNPAASQLLIGVTPPRARNLVYSIKQAGVPIGGVLASLSLPGLIALVDWRLALGISAALPLAILVMLRRHSVGPPRPASGTVRRSGFIAGQKLLFGDSTLATLAFIGFCYSTMQLSLGAFAVTTLVQEAAWPLVAAGAIAAVMQAAGAFGRIGCGWVADRFGGGMVVLGLLGIAGGAMAIALYFTIDMAGWLQILLFFALGALWLGWNGVLLAETARRASGERVGEATGAVLVYTFAGVIVGPSSFALVADALDSFAQTFAVYAMFGFIGAAAAFRLCFAVRAA